MPGVVQPGIIGTRQDIADSVLLYRAEDHPFLMAAKKEGPPRQEIHQYQDGDRSPANKRGVKDGTDVAGFTESEAREIIETNSHHIRESYFVGKKAHTFTDVAGRKNLLQNEILNKTVMLKTGISEVLLDDVDQRDEGANGSETRGMGSWMSTTAQTTRPVPATSRPTADQIYTGAFASITEKSFKDLMAAVWKIRRKPGRFHAWCGIELKGLVSDWSMFVPNVANHTLIRSFDQSAESKKLSKVINILETDGGTVELHLEPNLRKDRDGGVELTTASNRSAFIMDMSEGYSVKFAQKPQRFPLPDQGGGPRGYVDAIFAAKCFPKLHAAILPGS